MTAFTYDPSPVRVVFGSGCVAGLPDELDRLGVRRAVVVSTPGQAELARRVAGTVAHGFLPRAVMHVPVAVAEAARTSVTERGADGLVAVGGGSATGLAKAVALTTGLPIVAVPTTYSGSEQTPVWGLTDAGVKTTGRDPRVLPRTVLYDPDLTAALPPAVAGPSGMNALAHAVEALYAPDRSPVVTLMAEEAVRALGRALPVVVSAPDGDNRAGALYGAWLAGAALGATTMGLHHKLCHVLGGTFDLPHAEVHAVILPYALAYNAPYAPDADAAVARALGATGSGAAAVHRLARAVSGPPSLASLHMPIDGLDRAADLTTRSAYPNPRPVTRDGVRTILRQAYDGAVPS